MAVLEIPSFYYPMQDQFQEVHSHLDVMIIGTQEDLAMIEDPCINKRVSFFIIMISKGTFEFI